MLFNSFVKSHLQFCIIAWCNGNQTLQLRLQRAENKFLRIAFNLDYSTNVEAIYKNNNIFYIQQLHQLEIGMFMFRYINGILPWVYKIF